MIQAYIRSETMTRERNDLISLLLGRSKSNFDTKKSVSGEISKLAHGGARVCCLHYGAVVYNENLCPFFRFPLFF